MKVWFTLWIISLHPYIMPLWLFPTQAHLSIPLYIPFLLVSNSLPPWSHLHAWPHAALGRKMRPYKGVSCAFIQLMAIHQSVLFHVTPSTPNSANKAWLPGWETWLKQEQNLVLPGSQEDTHSPKIKLLWMSGSELKCQLSSKGHDIMLDLLVMQYCSSPRNPNIQE